MVDKMLSKQLDGCVKQRSKLQLQYDEYYAEDGTILEKSFWLPWYYHGFGKIGILYDPWTGLEIENALDIFAKDAEERRHEALAYCQKYGHRLPDNEYAKLFIEVTRKSLEEETKRDRQRHKYSKVCSYLSSYLKGGHRDSMTSIIHVPNIRTYAILNKKEYGGFEPMDYCPFCGAKLPSRLDDKLSNILQKEYGLKDWHDYKKAPHEFHTNKWWIKREL